MAWCMMQCMITAFVVISGGHYLMCWHLQEPALSADPAESQRCIQAAAQGLGQPDLQVMHPLVKRLCCFYCC